MHVSFVIYGALGQATGGYIYDRLIVEGLRAAGDDVEVVSIEPGEPPRWVASDVVVGDALCARELGPAFAEITALRVLLIHHLRSWEVEITDRDRCRDFEAAAIRASDEIIVTSEATAQRLAREFPGSRPHVIVPGADRLVSKPRSPRAAGPVRLLAIGSLIPRKRLLLVLDALDRLAIDSALRVAGDPERDPDHARAIGERIARSPRLRRSVTLLGVVDDDRLAIELSQADALILASSLEGYGMVLAEAMHAGLPVIVSRQAALPELIRDSQDALIFDDLVGLEQAICQLPRAAPEASRSLPTWKATISTFRTVLTNAIDGAARARLRERCD